MDYGKEIAKKALEINAIKLRPDDPFTWASGYRMPIYNDNRMFLFSPENRKLIRDGFGDLIKDVPYDMIAGTSTAGIAPAASLTNLLGVPLVIIEDGKSYIFEQPFTVGVEEDFDGVASTCPWAIPFGVSIANKKQLPFMYIRQSKKAHGLKQQIEGVPVKDQKILLLDYHRGDSYLGNAINALEEKRVKVRKIISKDISNIVKPVNLEGKTVPVLEDLISTGGSSAKAVQGIRDANGKCDYCFSIFDYGLDKAVQAFDSLDPKCKVSSLLTYDTLLEVAKETGYINDQQTKMLDEWRADPFAWGEKHGFSKVEK
ncbi:hypothetical protein KAJ87_00495 [Candidatus Pacearchaeota archaeon]|nr:hypothetical protein [Candidatus Pacearchaeota archaeon]